MPAETGAAYVFRVTFSLSPATVRLSPRRFETVVEYPAPTPGTAGWRFFQEALWRGEVGDEPSMRDRLGDWLGVPVESVSFRELRTTEAYLDALERAIDADPGAFDDDAAAVLKKHLGSSIHVRDP